MNALTLPRELIDSRRWRALSPAARAIFIELSLADIGDGSPIEFTNRQAALDCKSSLGAVARGFQALRDAGFIIQASGRQRVASKWRIAAAFAEA
jgi:hypothetical protein